MNDLAQRVAHLVKLNGGEIVGKTRLQKTAFLLEAAGLGYGFSFDYHHYGPFSADLAQAASDAEDFRYLITEEKIGHHFIPYVVYKTSEEFVDPLEDQHDEKRTKMLEEMEKYSAVELELAATAVWLRNHGFEKDSVDELQRLKPEKATRKRIKRAITLGNELGLV